MKEGNNFLKNNLIRNLKQYVNLHKVKNNYEKF